MRQWFNEPKEDKSDTGGCCENGSTSLIKNVYAVAKTVADTCGKVNQLMKLVDYNESLGFTFQGRNVR